MDNDPILNLQQRVNNLVSRMTLAEKISQMVYQAPAIERLTIPAYNWWNEGLHGLGRAGVATVFPQAIGLAATWNPDLLFEVATVISDEARAKHHEAARRDYRGIYAGLTIWSPNINIFRDPRWGRGQETYGEDPTLSAQMGVAFIKGLQGDDPHYLKTVATPKHYAVHSGPESTRHHFDAQVNERDIREFYVFAFEACIKEGQAASIMGAYNRVNGEPCCASHFLLEKILRQEWGFDGYVVSDCEAIRDIFENHRVVDTAAEAAALAVNNGCELNCGTLYAALLEAVEQGLITEETIDAAVKLLFTARFRLGMFDSPEDVPFTQIPYEIVDSAEHRALARRAARESIVLLKNENNLLPLSKDIASIALIGPNADDPSVLLGNYNGTPQAAVTPLEGIRRKLSAAAKVYTAQGCEIADGMPPLQVIPSTCLRPAGPASGEHGLRAFYYDGLETDGLPTLSRIDHTVDFVWKDTNPITLHWTDSFSARWDGFLIPPVSGTYRLAVNGYSAYRFFLDGTLLAASDHIHHPQLISCDIELEAGRHYEIQLDLANRGLDPQIQLLWALPEIEYESGALEAAKKADVVILAMGLSPRLEGEEMPVAVDGFADGCRTDIQLPQSQQNLIKQIHALGKPIVLLLLNGSALAVNWAAEHLPAIVEAWYPGQAGGEAIADVLFGDSNPSGKLPVTFYKSVDDLPPYDDYQLEGHTYRYFRREPLYPFGYGLSYTTFRIDNLRTDQSIIAAGEQIAVRVDVTNTGQQAGDEVVQLYTRQDGASTSQPLKELKGFKRLTLQPGQRKTVTFTLHSSQFGSYDEKMQFAIKPGTVEVMVGSSSQDLPLNGRFEISAQPSSMDMDKTFFAGAVVD